MAHSGLLATRKAVSVVREIISTNRHGIGEGVKKDSKDILEKKKEILRGAKNHLKLETSYANWNNALKLSPVFSHHEDFGIAKELYRYICDSLEPSINYFWWLKTNRPEEKRSEKECMIAWIDWMISCLNEDLQALAEEERRRRDWNPITHPDGPPRAECDRTIIIKLY